MSYELPGHGPCFICGAQSKLGVTFLRQDDGTVETRVILPIDAQGPPGHAHGGCLAAILDEVMGACAWSNGHQVMAVHLELDYHIPVPLGVEVKFRAWLEPCHGDARPASRKVMARGSAILPDGRIATSARGVFARAPEEMVARMMDGIASAWAKRG